MIGAATQPSITPSAKTRPRSVAVVAAGGLVRLDRARAMAQAKAHAERPRERARGGHLEGVAHGHRVARGEAWL